MNNLSPQTRKIVVQFNIKTNMTDSEIKEMVEKTLTIGGVPLSVEDALCPKCKDGKMEYPVDDGYPAFCVNCGYVEDEPKFDTMDDLFGDLPPRTDWQELRMAFTVWRCNLKGKIRNALHPPQEER